ncbi:MAG: acyl-CoA dehydrogenase family protein [Actinomycetota bacterium]
MTHDVLTAARELGPSIGARSEAIEAERRLPLDIVDQMRAAGAFRMYVPDDLGGVGVSAWESLQVIEEFAYHDAAAGWCSMIGSTTSLLASSLPDPFAQEIFGDASTISGGFAMPVGKAVVVEGGLRVTGRWPWGSGTQHCDWIGGGCLIVDEDGNPSARGDGLIAPYVFFRAEDVSFIDTWHVMGLSGSGSCDYQVENVFVPEGRWVQIGLDEPVRSNSLSRFSIFGLLACGVASCAVGVARRSIDELLDLATGRRPQGSARTLAERESTQKAIADAEARLGSAWAFMHEAVDTAWVAAQAGEPQTLEHRRQLRLSATHAVQTSADVGERMFKLGGGSAVYRQNRLQMTLRDVLVAGQHALVAPSTMETCGRMRLGLDVNEKML